MVEALARLMQRGPDDQDGYAYVTFDPLFLGDRDALEALLREGLVNITGPFDTPEAALDAAGRDENNELEEPNAPKRLRFVLPLYHDP